VLGTPTVVRWRKRVWRCPDPRCPVRTFFETHDLVAPRARLTTRAIGWATDALSHELRRYVTGHLGDAGVRRLSGGRGGRAQPGLEGGLV
jgi:hypothetical protein